jgi:hypothetical protein
MRLGKEKTIMDVTYLMMDYMDLIAKHFGKESGRDLTKEDIDRWEKEIFQPFVHKMVGIDKF